jgi:hypothetical protein
MKTQISPHSRQVHDPANTPRQNAEERKIVMLAKTFTLIAALTATSPVDAAPMSQRLLNDATRDVSVAIKAPLLFEATDKVMFADVEGDRVRIAPSTLSNVTTPNEARALVALLIAYRGTSFGRLNLKTSGLLDTVTGIGYSIAESASGKSNTLPGARDVPLYTADEQRDFEIKLGQKRAALAVETATRAGSCAGPLVDLLKRMRKTTGGTSATADAKQQSSFARQALRDLGATAYPPDRSCQTMSPPSL